MLLPFPPRAAFRAIVFLASAMATVDMRADEQSAPATPPPIIPAATPNAAPAAKTGASEAPAVVPNKAPSPANAGSPPATPAEAPAPAKPKPDDDLLNPGPAKPKAGDDLLNPATAKPKPDDDLLGPGPAKPKTDDDLLSPGPGGPPAKPSAGDDLLLPTLPGPGPSPLEPSLGRGPLVPTPKPKTSGVVAAPAPSAADEHAKLLIEGKFPSASTCSVCHPTQFRQWGISQHAYAQLSPVFNTMQATIDKRTSGSNGDFCIRCHTQVGMQISEPIFISNMDRAATSREGITCIVCHRVKADYGKVSGRTAIAEGDIFEPVYGPKGNAILKGVIAKADEYNIVTKRGEVGRSIHTDVIKFDPLEKSNFCGTCHDVNLLNGFRLEEAFTQFKNSPANKRGETCQDCHMGKTPGIKSGYEFGPAAKIGDKTTPPRKLTNHSFAGPDYSIIHPGLFPFNVKAQELATMREWLQFNYKAGWGTDAFEKSAPPDYVFPPRWQAIDDRYDARAILDDQLASLEDVNKQRYQILRRGFRLGELALERNDAGGIKFKVKVFNGTDGHGAPTGFDAERANFLQVVVTDRTGKVMFQSGDRDPNGDIRDEESTFVHNWKLPWDKYLFSLQSKFLVALPHGGEKVQILPTNKSIDPLPFIRPPTNAAILLGRPTGARKQALGLPPGGFRWAPYEVGKRQLTGKPPYKVNIKFITQMVPVNLVADIADVGFDYNMSVKKIADEVVTRSQILWDKTIILPEKPVSIDLRPSESEIMAPPYKSFLPELAHAKVLAKAEPEKKKEIPPLTKTQGAEKVEPALPMAPDKKAPEMKEDAPDTKKDAPEIKKDAPEIKKDAPEAKDAPDVKKDTPDAKKDTETKQVTPGAKKDAPETNKDADAKPPLQ
jgi:hypothetical protein